MTSFLRWTTILATVTLLLLLVACTVRVTATPSPTAMPSPTKTPVPIKRVISVPPTRIALPDPGVSNATIIATMKQNPGVLDAAISQQGERVSLVLIVHPLTNESGARQLGDNFVRMFKSLSDDEAPGRSIGTGKYDYLIGVYYPNENKVAQGAKSRVAQGVSW